MLAVNFDKAAKVLEKLWRQSNRYDRPVVAVIPVIRAPTEHLALPVAAGITKHLLKTERMPTEELARRANKPMNDVTFHDVARSIDAFIRSAFRLKDTKFQKFVFGNATLTPDELKGGLIFYGKGKCVNCHNGPYFSDLKFHAVPFPQLGFGKNGFGVDYGRFNVTFQGEDLYRFRTPPLFNVHKTAPYGHPRSIANLRDAIGAHFDPLRNIDLKSMDNLARHEFFKRMAAVGGTFKMLGVLNEREVGQVESFLKTLSFDSCSTHSPTC